MRRITLFKLFSPASISHWLFSITLALTAGSASADIILADSVNDWLAATNDGIGVGGTNVLAGSADDAAQQGHADTEGSGIWNYKGVDNPAGGTFSATPGFFTDWNQGTWVQGNTVRMGIVSMSPTSTFGGSTVAVREWFGSGLNGETLRVSGEFSTTFNMHPPSATNNGVHLLVLVDNQVYFDQLMAPGGTESFDFNVTATHDTPRIRFIVGPDGPIPGATGVNDFFNDSTQFRGQIHKLTAVPEPWMAGLFLVGLAGVFGRRQTAGA